MSARVFVKLHGIDDVISHLRHKKDDFPNKVNEFLERLAIIGATEARVSFTRAFYAGHNDVEISVDRVKDGYRINARGQAVLFIEFGTGVLNPEHPLSAELGFSHGTYGKGKGSNPKGWVYTGEQGNAGRFVREGVYRTTGNPPARAMYDAGKDVRREIYEIAKEVFADD